MCANYASRFPGGKLDYWADKDVEEFATSYWGSYETVRLMDNPLLGLECEKGHADAVRADLAKRGVGSAGQALSRPGVLERMFTAVGLIERFNESMVLFTSATGLPNLFTTAAQLGDVHEDERLPARMRDQGQTLPKVMERLEEGALASAAVQAAIADDVLLYQAAEALFEKQLTALRTR